MFDSSSNLRKAAVLLRSMDSETAGIMLAQLSSEEATALRAAIRELGTIDADEQSDVIAEFRRTRPAIPTRSQGGVELELSASVAALDTSVAHAAEPAIGTAKRFEFLASAPTHALVPYLAREHAQTIAVVLSHLAPARAAAVLAALPNKLQAETIERLAALGETDPESVTALERELAAWMASRTEDRGTIAKRRETIANILGAADTKTRRGILSKLRLHNEALAEQIAPGEESFAERDARPDARERRFESKQANDTSARIRRQLAPTPMSVPVVAPVPVRPSLPRIEFDQLVNLDTQALTALIRSVDPNVLAIALAGSNEDMLERVCSQMPKRTGREFRRELRRLGPMRLSDVEGAQRAMADTAAKYLMQRRELATARG